MLVGAFSISSERSTGVIFNRNAHEFFAILAGVSLRLSTLGWRQHCGLTTFRILTSLFVRSGARKKRGVMALNTAIGFSVGNAMHRGA
jgi:hypothetical protein